MNSFQGSPNLFSVQLNGNHGVEQTRALIQH